jgi:hypothetical protein
MDEALTKYEKLEVVMYAMTLNERADRKNFWMHEGGFARMHRRGSGALFNYWKNRLDSDPATEALLNECWEKFIQAAENPGINSKIPEGRTEATPAKLSAIEKAKSLLQAAKNFTASGFVFASDEVYNQRLAVCTGCEFWNSAAFLNTGSCTLCGCSTKAKLKLPLEKCPVDKWLPV